MEKILWKLPGIKDTWNDKDLLIQQKTQRVMNPNRRKNATTAKKIQTVTLIVLRLTLTQYLLLMVSQRRNCFVLAYFCFFAFALQHLQLLCFLYPF